MVVSGRRRCRHCGRGGRCWCDRRARPRRPRRGCRGTISRDGSVSESLPRAAVSTVRVIVVTTGTFSIAGITHVVGVAARSVSAGGVVPDVSFAVVPSSVTRVVRSSVIGGTALGFELLPCDVVRADFNSSSSPQFMRLAYGARDTRVEEDAFY